MGVGRNLAMSITVYSKPRCPQCDATYRKLKKLGVAHESVDVTKDEDSLNLIKGLGYQQAPVVAVRGGDGAILETWGGFRPDRIEKAAALVAA